MLTTGLKYAAIALFVCATWFVLIAFSPILLSSPGTKIISVLVTASIATFFSVAFAYWFSPKYKVYVSVLVMILSVLIAFPVYGPGGVLIVSLELQGAGYLPPIAVLITGVITIATFTKKAIYHSENNYE